MSFPVAPYLYLPLPLRPSVIRSCTLEPDLTLRPSILFSWTVECLAVTVWVLQPRRMPGPFAPLGGRATPGRLILMPLPVLSKLRLGETFSSGGQPPKRRGPG